MKHIEILQAQATAKRNKLVGQERMQLRDIANRRSVRVILEELASQAAPDTAEYYALTICAQELATIERRNKRIAKLQTGEQ